MSPFLSLGSLHTLTFLLIPSLLPFAPALLRLMQSQSHTKNGPTALSNFTSSPVVDYLCAREHFISIMEALGIVRWDDFQREHRSEGQRNIDVEPWWIWLTGEKYAVCFLVPPSPFSLLPGPLGPAGAVVFHSLYVRVPWMCGCFLIVSQLAAEHRVFELETQKLQSSAALLIALSAGFPYQRHRGQTHYSSQSHFPVLGFIMCVCVCVCVYVCVRTCPTRGYKWIFL